MKHHGQPHSPSPLPADNDQELKRARDQLKEASKLVGAISTALDLGSGLAEDPAAAIAARQALAALLDLALSFADEQVNSQARAEVLRCVVQGRVVVDAAPALLLWFAPGSIVSTGAACIIRSGAEGTREAFIDPAAVPGTWWPDAQLGPDDADLRSLIDDELREMLKARMSIPAKSETDLNSALLEILDLTPDSASEPASTRPTEGECTESVSTGQEADPPGETPQSTTEPASRAVEATADANSSTICRSAVENSGQPGPASVAPKTVTPPAAYIGWSEPAARYCLLGNIVGTSEQVALDLDNPKAIGVFG